MDIGHGDYGDQDSSLWEQRRTCVFNLSIVGIARRFLVVYGRGGPSFVLVIILLI